MKLKNSLYKSFLICRKTNWFFYEPEEQLAKLNFYIEKVCEPLRIKYFINANYTPAVSGVQRLLIFQRKSSFGRKYWVTKKSTKIFGCKEGEVWTQGLVGWMGGIRKLSTCTQDPVAMWGNLLQNIFVAFSGFHVIFLGFERHQNGKRPNITTG